MSEISEKLQAKLSRAEAGEAIMNILLGVWALATVVCFIADVVKVPAAMVVLGITAVLITAIDGYFLFSVFRLKRKIRKQNQEEGVVARYR